MYTSEAVQYTSKASINTTNRILVVEDEELIRETIALALEEEGYVTMAVADGRAALECHRGRRSSGRDH